MEANIETEPGPYAILNLLLSAPLSSSSIVIAILVVCLLLIASALISGSEVAFFSLSDNDKKKLRDQKSAKTTRIHRLLEKPRYLLATILIANNVLNIAIIILTYFILGQFLDGIAEIPRLLIEVIGITFVIVLFGEVMPKIYATYNNILFAGFMATPLLFLSILFRPFSFLLVRSTRFLDKKIEERRDDAVSLEEIDRAIDLTSRHIEKDEIKLLKGIVKFGNIIVKQVMKSRLDMVKADFESNYQELYELVIESGFSRIPIFKEDLDSIEGIIYAKDLLAHLDKPDNFDWHHLIRPTLFVPETKKIEELLREFQTKRTHMAIVVDEYGGTAGLITLEDIMEEIIGEIKDEFDEHNELGYQKINANNFIFQGKTLINDFCKLLSLDPNIFEKVKGDSESLAGLLLEIKGRIPVENDEIKYKTFKFVVISADRKKIEKIKVTLIDQNQESLAKK